MIERLIGSCFARPLAPLALVLALACAGAVGLQELPRDVFPDMSAPLFNVIVQNPAMMSEELEASVAIPLEAALAGLPDVRRIRSTSQLGVCQITVEFEPRANPLLSRQLVAERLAQAAALLPQGTDPPLLSSLTGRLNEILEFTLEAKDGALDPMSLRDLADAEVAHRLLAVPGVAAVERLGGMLRQFQVLLDPPRMAARGVALDDVMRAASEAGGNAAGGFVAQGPMEWSVRAVGSARTLDDLRGTVVAVRGGVPVLMGDVATLREGPAPRRGMASHEGREVVSCRVVKQFGADTVAVASGVRQAMEELRGTMPPGVRLRLVYDQSRLVRTSLGGVGRAVAIGASLVALVLLWLLGQPRAALLVAITIPLSIAMAGLVLHLSGEGLNTMTLGGLAIAVGLLVDASIIMVDNIAHRMTLAPAGSPRSKIALQAATEVGRPIAFATAIVMAVFLPLLGMQGIEGLMYRPLAVAVLAAVGSSLVLALVLVPLLAAAMLRPRGGTRGEDTAPIRAIKRLYAPLLDLCLRRAGLVRLLTLGLTLPALGLALTLGSDFMPRLDEGAFLIQTLLPPEASLEEVDRLNHRVEEILRGFPDVADVTRRTGRAERTEDPMPHTLSDVLVVFRHDRTRPLEALESEMREGLGRVPGVVSLFTTPLGMRIDEGLGGTPADISVRLFGPDLETLALLAERARQVMQDVPGLEDLRAERLTGLPQLRVTVDRAAAAREGLTPAEVVRAARVGMAGEVVSEIRVGTRRHDVVVRLPEGLRDGLEAIRHLPVDTHGDRRLALHQVARIEETFGPGAIRREAGMRRAAVEGSVSGRDPGSVARAVKSRLARGLSLPTGYFLDVGGRVEGQARATRALALAITLAVLAVLVLLYLALGSLGQALVILATLPDAFVGGILALLLAGEAWSVPSLVGLIALLGIAVQNGLVLTTQTRLLVAQGMPFPAALREASIGRVRPKLLTAATAMLGLAPLLVSGLHGTEIERPLAIVMIGGLVTSTLFTLLALPGFTMLSHSWGKRTSHR